MNIIFKNILITLGILALLLGLVMALAGLSIAPDDPERFNGLLGGVVATLVLFVVGHGLIVFAVEEIKDPAKQPEVTGPLLHKLGLVLILILLWQVAVCLPLLGRVILAALLLVALARYHSDWSSKKVIGRTTFGKIFDETIGTVYYFVVIVIMGLISGATGGIIGGGGGSGGGGASGSW
jgi:hypothetical protein